MKKNFNFGKIAYQNNRKENLVVVNVEYRNGVFKASGSIFNRLGTDILSGGQNLDEIKKYIKNKTFNKIYNIWKEYHLNDMTSGSPKQEQFIKNLEDLGFSYDYDFVCKQLEKNNLLIDKSYLHNGKPYRYGSAWLMREIPTDVKNKINLLMEVQ